MLLPVRRYWVGGCSVMDCEQDGMKRCIWLGLLGALTIPAQAGAYPKLSDRSKYGAMKPQEIDAQINEAAQFRSMRRRILRHSALMLGAHYRVDPLGEGAGGQVDKDPRFQLSPVDCVTFVETTLALSLAGDLDEAHRWMDRLRYSGSVVGYRRRNHFMLAQWLPHMRRHRILRDITRKIADGPDLEHDYSAVPWEAIASRHLPMHFEGLPAPTGRVTLPLLTLDDVEAHKAQIPTGAILLLARVERPKIPVRISHLGFVIHQRNGRTIFRHASQEGWGRVVDEDLIAYLRRLDERSKWGIQGVNIQMPRHPKTLPGRLKEPGKLARQTLLP